MSGPVVVKLEPSEAGKSFASSLFNSSVELLTANAEVLPYAVCSRTTPAACAPTCTSSTVPNAPGVWKFVKFNSSMLTSPPTLSPVNDTNQLRAVCAILSEVTFTTLPVEPARLNTLLIASCTSTALAFQNTGVLAYTSGSSPLRSSTWNVLLYKSAEILESW